MANRRPRTAAIWKGARLAAILSVLGLSILSSGYSSCAGATGPLLVPLLVTPTEVLLRASQVGPQEAIGLARVDGGEAEDQYEVSVDYGKNPPVAWLLIEVKDRNLTLHANAGGLLPDATYVATVTVTGVHSGASASLRVEFNVTQ